MTTIELLEKERLSLESGGDPINSKSFLSNEFFYEKIYDTIHWDEKKLMTHGNVTKLFIRTIIEAAYREGKIDGLERASEIIFQNQS